MGLPYYDDANIIGLFQSKYEQRFEGSWAGRLSLYNGDSNSAAEDYALFGGFPKMREWIGARQAQTLAGNQYQIRNKPYESTLVVPQRMLTRDKSGLLEAHVGNYADGVVVNHWEDLLINLINTNGLCADGENYYDTDHPTTPGSTQKNIITSSEVPALNVVDPTAPTPLEMATVIMSAAAWLLTLQDDKGRYVNGNARKFVVVVSTVPLYTAAMQSISSNLLTGLVDNPLSGLKIGGFTFDVKLVPALTSATQKVRVFREDGELKPFILQQEQDIQYSMLGEGSDFFFENKAYKLGVDSSRGAGYGLYEQTVEAQLV